MSTNVVKSTQRAKRRSKQKRDEEEEKVIKVSE